MWKVLAFVLVLVLLLIAVKGMNKKFDVTHTSLKVGEKIHVPQYLASPDGAWALRFVSGQFSMYNLKGKAWDLTPVLKTNVPVLSNAGNLVISDGAESVYKSFAVFDTVCIDTSGNLIMRDANKEIVAMINALGESVLSLSNRAITAATNMISKDGAYVMKDFSIYKTSGMSKVWDLAPIWGGDLTVSLYMQSDGNLVAYAAGKPIWGTNTNSRADIKTLKLDNNGNLALGADGATIVAINSFGILFSEMRGGCISVGRSLVSSNMQYMLKVDLTNNCAVVDTTGKVLWNLPVTAPGIIKLCMQGDGNLVGYDTTGKVTFASNTGGNSGAVMFLQNSGKLMLTDAKNVPLCSITADGLLYPKLTARAVGFGLTNASKQWLASPSGSYILKIAPTSVDGASGVLGVYKADGTKVFDFLKNNAVCDKYNQFVDGKLYVMLKNANVWISSVASPNASAVLDDSNGNFVILDVSGKELLRISAPQ